MEDTDQHLEVFSVHISHIMAKLAFYLGENKNAVTAQLINIFFC